MIAALFPLLALVLSVADSVNAHGYVQQVTIGGQKYAGWLPFEDPYKSPQPQTVIRHVPSDGPVLDVHDPALACNVGGETGTQKVAAAAAGSKIIFTWNQWLADHLGPVSVYMASCGGSCKTFNTAGAKWFKIDAAGYDPKNKKWASTQLIDNGNSWTSVIPASLTPGEYLVRNEVIALHSAGAPQFYPSCAQVKVTGGGSATPSGAQTVTIPGIYDNVHFPDIWLDSFNSFTIPGPAVFGGAGNGTPPPVNAAPPPPSSTPTTTPSHRSQSSHPSSVQTASVTPATTLDSPSKIASSPPLEAPPTAPTGRCRRNTRRSNRITKRHAFVKRHH